MISCAPTEHGYYIYQPKICIDWSKIKYEIRGDMSSWILNSFLEELITCLQYGWWEIWYTASRYTLVHIFLSFSSGRLSYKHHASCFFPSSQMCVTYLQVSHFGFRRQPKCNILIPFRKRERLFCLRPDRRGRRPSLEGRRQKSRSSWKRCVKYILI